LSQHLFDPVDGTTNVDRSWLQMLAAREGEEMSGQRGTAVCSAKCGLD
jgi:hypothetical protein